MSNIEVLIQNGNDLYVPVVKDDITWETQRKGVPGTLNLNIVKDGVINFQEGNAIRIKYNDNNVFYGFVFEKKRSKDGVIKVTAYDQLRYLKNKDTYVYTNKTASEVITMLAKDFNLQVGSIEDTKYKIASRVEEDKTLFDIIENALSLTLENKKEMYVFYDDFGKLTLKNISSMKLDTLIDGDTVENYDYSSNINNSYNKVKLSKDNKDTGKREIYISQDTSNINKWGVLQHFEKINENVDGKNKADGLLKLYNQKTRSLNIKNALGDIRVRAGSIIAVILELGDINVKNYMLVDKCKHKFTSELHTMDLTLVGGEFVSTMASSSTSSSSSSSTNTSTSSGSNNTTGGTSSSNTSNSNNTTNSKADKLISYAKSKLGKPYVWGATGPNSFDCSGLTSWCYKQIGVTIPRTSREQSKAGKYVSKSNLQPGDLLFFKNPVSHVGMYIGNNQMIHAPKPGDVVKTVSITSSYYKSNYNTARRFL